MNGFFSILIWCELQIGIVAAVGIGLASLFHRRCPQIADSIIATTVLVGWLLTLTAPIPIHRWMPFDMAAKTISRIKCSSDGRTCDLPEITVSESASTSSSVPMLDVTQLLCQLRAVDVQVADLGRTPNITFQLLCLVFAILVAFGVIQLAYGIYFIRTLRCRSVPVTDLEFLLRLKSLAESLSCRTVPEVRESGDFTDAAVVGWRRPVVILPSHWHLWSADEIQAVLTHEMAHIVRRDVLWRTFASMLLSLHFYNPLLHWLMRRLTLCQELATDEMAALAVGPRDYLRALSSLALRQDELFGRGVAPNMLPVFSGQLIRRITMLRSWKSTQHRRRTILQASVSVALLTLGAALAVTRGMAQQPNGDTKPSADFIRTASLTKSVVTSGSTLDPTREMFHRPPIGTSIIGAKHPDGMFAVRLGELLSTPQINTFVPMMNAGMSHVLATILKTDSQPSVRLENVKWIAGIPQIVCQKEPAKAGETSEPKTRLMFGVGRFMVKLNEPLDLKAWVKAYAPQAVQHVIEGQDVFQWQSAAMGPLPYYVWMQDDTTLRLSLPNIKEITSETRMADLLAGVRLDGLKQESLPVESNSGVWSSTWQRIDTGLMSVVLARADLSGLLFDFENRKSFQAETLDAIEEALLALRSRCQMTTCSLDLSATSQIGFRISLVHPSHKSSALSAEDLKKLLKQSQTFLLSLEPDGDYLKENHERQKAIKNICDLIESATISVDDYDDHTSAVVLATTIPFARVAELVLADFAAK